jgi:hypothetical protein
MGFPGGSGDSKRMYIPHCNTIKLAYVSRSTISIPIPMYYYSLFLFLLLISGSVLSLISIANPPRLMCILCRVSSYSSSICSLWFVSAGRWAIFCFCFPSLPPPPFYPTEKRKCQRSKMGVRIEPHLRAPFSCCTSAAGVSNDGSRVRVCVCVCVLVWKRLVLSHFSQCVGKKHYTLVISVHYIVILVGHRSLLS